MNKIVNKVTLCKWLNLTPEQVDSLPYEDYLKYSVTIRQLEGKSVL